MSGALMASEVELSKLSIPKLKALCKERNIVGYSKLNKGGLVQKLLAGPTNAERGGTALSNEKASNTTNTGQISQSRLPEQGATSGVLEVQSNSTEAPNTGTVVHSELSNPNNDGTGQQPMQPPSNAVPKESTKRPCPDSTPSIRPRKSARPNEPSENPVSVVSSPRNISLAPIASNSTNVTNTDIMRLPVGSRDSGPRERPSNQRGRQAELSSIHPTASTTSTVNARTSVHAPNISNPGVQSTIPDAQSVPTSDLELSRSGLPKMNLSCEPSRGQQKIPTSSISKSIKRTFLPLVTKNLPAKKLVKKTILCIDKTTTTRSISFGFSAFYRIEAMDLAPITPSPPISKRRIIQAWALALRCVEDPNDLRHCVLVSKWFRYAVYASARFHLERFYSGKRLDTLMELYQTKHVNLKTLNMWPYLLQRQKEREYSKQLFRQSFLGRVFGNRWEGVTSVWHSPNHTEELDVTIKFLLTRVWYALSTDQSTAGVQALINTDTIVHATAASSSDELWNVKVSRGENLLESYLIIKSTGDIIGKGDSGAASPFTTSLHVRSDWSQFLKSSQDQHLKRSSLWQHLRWPNHEEYTQGISRLWLNRIINMGEEGTVLREIAERYVLASVVGNSYSGKYMTASEMEYEFNGNGSSEGLLRRRDHPRISMFLPIHHHVESVHLSTSRGRPLHPALAIVFTSAREYLVLKDNGMTVGCEEDGVVPVWMGILRCSRDGEQVQDD